MEELAEFFNRSRHPHPNLKMFCSSINCTRQIYRVSAPSAFVPSRRFATTVPGLTHMSLEANHTSVASARVSRGRVAARAPATGVHAANVHASLGSSSDDLLIVGPGVLGSRLASLWLESHPSATVVGQTNTTNNHAFLASIGVTPRVGPTADTYPNVAFCAPPSGSSDYAGDVARALSMWDGSGNFIFTSSAGVYDVNDGSECSESSPTVAMGASPRTDVLLTAEQNALAAGGNVVRLVGLYHRTRGAHTFFLKQGNVARPGSYMVNLIHYEDAARLCASVLEGGEGREGFRGEVFVGCDGAPVSFRDMMASIERAGLEGLEGRVVFEGEDGVGDLGKRMGNTWTKERLGWGPRFESVEAFFEGESRGVDWWCGEGKGLGMPHA